jgi:hypothetical protein
MKHFKCSLQRQTQAMGHFEMENGKINFRTLSKYQEE